MFKLRNYQNQAKQDIHDFLFDSGSNRGIVVQPTGAGKALITGIIAEMSKDPVLVIQPNLELLEQNLEKARALGLDPSVYSASAGTKEISDLTYATPMSIASKPELFERFHTVALDECHISLTNSVTNGKVRKKGKVSEFLEKIKPEKIIGLTATPIQLVSSRSGAELRMINRSLRSFWNRADLIHLTQIADIASEYWADIEIEIDRPGDFSQLRLNSNSSEFTSESLIRQYDENELENKIVSKYHELKEQGFESILVFVPSVDQAHSLARRNPEFRVVTEKTPKKERAQIVHEFKNLEVPVLINVGIFTTGFDHPELDVVIMASETNSFSLYYQQFGRLVRPLIVNGQVHRVKKKLIDLTDNTNRFGDLRDTRFEKNDYTRGWAMWNNDRLMTGYPFGKWDMPTRQEIIQKTKKLNSNSKSNTGRGITLSFGKYKNMELSTAFKKDPGYFVWMVNNIDFDKPWNQHLLAPISELIHKYTLNSR